jgi:hypothetical protein
MRNKRKKVWIDRLQTHLSLYIALYFIIYQVAVWSVTVLSEYMTTPLETVVGDGARGFGLSFVVIVAVLLCGVFIYDAVHLTHRVVGPLYRFRQVIRAVTAGEEVALIQLRKRDYLGEMRDEFNEMLKALEQRGAVVLKTTSAAREELVSR